MEDIKFLEKLTNVIPTENQINILEMGYYNFMHFGLNTYTGKEWGSGSVEPSAFRLKSLDADKWVSDLISTGSRGVILTAKHHDGFCLFPSIHTDYTIAHSPYKGGKGDIVGELSKACAKRNFKLGIYLSPWDRHEKSYGTARYNDFFCHQLTELCTNYGEIFCFWFDGACGEGSNGKTQTYDWNRYFELIRRLQPNACISNCGEDLRWIGNEYGIARNSEWSIVPKRLQCYDKVMAESQQKAGALNMLSKIDHRDKNLGERSTLINEDELVYWPSEMNIPITYVGWFYNIFFHIFFVRSVRNLVKCYCNSVGNNSTFLVNFPPNKNGEIPKKYIKRMAKAKQIVDNYFSKEIAYNIIYQNDKELTIKFNRSAISKLILSEDITEGQRIENFEVIINNKTVYSGTTIGYKTFAFFAPQVTDNITIRILSSRLQPHFNIKVFE